MFEVIITSSVLILIIITLRFAQGKRLNMIIQNKKTAVPAFVIVIILTVAAVGCTFTGAGTQEDNFRTNTLEDSRIEEAYQSARKAMSWFLVDTLPVSKDMHQIDDRHYYRVNHPYINTMADLRAHLESLFSTDIVNELLDTFLYCEIDGVLYDMPASRGTDIFKGEETLEIIYKNESQYTVSVTVENLGEDLTTVVGYSTHDMIYEMVDGLWVFTSFELLR